MRSETTAPRACGSACWCWQPCCPPSLTPAWWSVAPPLRPRPCKMRWCGCPGTTGRAFCCWARAGSCWQGACTPCRPCVRPMKPWLSGRSNCASPSIRSTAGAGNGWCSARSFAARGISTTHLASTTPVPLTCGSAGLPGDTRQMRNARPATLPARAWGWRTRTKPSFVSKTTPGSGAGSCRAARWPSATPKADPCGWPAWMWTLPPTTKWRTRCALPRPSQAPSTSPCPTPLALPA